MTKEELKEQIHERVYNIKVPTLGFSRRDLFNIAMEYAEPREKRIAELEKENAELKCECRRCVYTDCLCIPSDFGKDRNGICDHFKDVFDENAELKEKLEITDLALDNCLKDSEVEK